jgi:F-type H+-transporting ATPase subunit epsilon
MKLTIISQTKKLYEQDIVMVTVPGKEGELGILPGHANLISILDIGEVKIKEKDKEVTLAINGGIIEVKNDELIILANEAALAHELVTKEIDEAIKMAEIKRRSVLEPTELIQLEKQLRYEKLKRKMTDKLG